MDVRARLAQWSKRKPKRPLAAAARLPAWHAQGWPVSASGWLRLARRWGLAVLEFNVPPGAGATAAALLLLASASYGAVRGGHLPQIAEQVQDLCDAAANSAGLRISEVALAGQHEIGREDILMAAGISGRSSLLFLDASRTRARLMSNPWIAQATVLKLYPGRLRIEIVERKPFARWQKDGRVALIAADGSVLEADAPKRFGLLPLVVGEGAEHAAPDMLALLARYPELSRQVDAAVLVAERRWNLHLKTGVEVLLPERAPERALTTLLELERANKLLARDIVAVDLRLNDRVTVRLSDGAASAREQALKAAEKNKKPKAKGSDA
jgi:cell division protein FtsQ